MRVDVTRRKEREKSNTIDFSLFDIFLKVHSEIQFIVFILLLKESFLIGHLIHLIVISTSVSCSALEQPSPIRITPFLSNESEPEVSIPCLSV
jgi:hypothetical protein